MVFEENVDPTRKLLPHVVPFVDGENGRHGGLSRFVDNVRNDCQASSRIFDEF